MLHVAGARLKVYCSYYCPPPYVHVFVYGPLYVCVYVYMCVCVCVYVCVCVFFYTNRGRQFAVVIKFCSVALMFVGRLYGILLHVSLLAPRILR